MPTFEINETADLSRRPFDAALKQASEVAAGQIAQGLAGLDGPIAEAMRYATTGGKGLRGFLALESARLYGVCSHAAAPAAGAIEALHAYSLVHDDLPCMDDDDLRRGQPTVHRRWDEATAVLAGDALQSLAFQLVTMVSCDAERRVQLVESLATAAGARGMVGGQAQDIAAETAAVPLSLEQITQLQAGKTGALIGWACMVGPRMAAEPGERLQVYARCIGLAFQIADDVLDVEGDADTVGKATGKDSAAGKATFVSHLGLEGAKARARDLADEACEAVSSFGPEAETLKDCARFIISRRK